MNFNCCNKYMYTQKDNAGQLRQLALDTNKQIRHHQSFVTIIISCVCV